MLDLTGRYQFPLGSLQPSGCTTLLTSGMQIKAYRLSCDADCVRHQWLHGAVPQSKLIRNPASVWLPASLLGARTLLGAPGLTTRSKKLLGAKGIATRSKVATGLILRRNKKHAQWTFLDALPSQVARCLDMFGMVVRNPTLHWIARSGQPHLNRK